MKEFFKKLINFFKAPSAAISFFAYILTLLFIGAAITMLALDFQKPPLSVIAYAVFALSAIFLSYSVYVSIRFFPDIKRTLTETMKKSPFIARLMEQYGFRTLVFASISFLINIAYVAFHVVLAVIYRSVWYASLGGYYVLLTVMRGGIVLYHRKKLRGGASEIKLEIRRYTTVGILLTLMPICLSVAIIEMVTSERGYAYDGLIIYAVAAYTFYKITMAVINVFKARRDYGFTVEAVRNIGLADALVSVLGLQTAMFYSFGNEGLNTAAFNAATGAGVCLLTLFVGILMIIRSWRYKNTLKDTQKDE